MRIQWWHYLHPLVKNGGDWTIEVFDKVENVTTRIGFVRGPYPSPYSCAVEHDKLILCASGIGITPALSILTNPFLSQKRRANLVGASCLVLSFAPSTCRNGSE